MFDFIKCKAPLPIWGFENRSFQTKSTPSQLVDNYIIKEDGTLWFEGYDIVDRSDPTSKGIERLVGMMSRENIRHVFCHDFTGDIYFYDFVLEKNNKQRGWVEFKASFEKGRLTRPIEIFKIE